MNRAFIALLLLGCMAVQPLVPSDAKSSKSVARKKTGAAPLTGTYVNRYSNVSNRLEIQQLPDGQVKFQLTAILTGTDSPRNGEVSGIAPLKGNIALFDDGEGCRVRIDFADSNAKVGVPDCDACGFGAFVTADGEYKKISAKKPKFDF